LELALYAHDMTAAGYEHGMVGAGVEEELHNVSDYIRDSHDGPERSVLTSVSWVGRRWRRKRKTLNAGFKAPETETDE
jgi:hypothetical protein